MNSTKILYDFISKNHNIGKAGICLSGGYIKPNKKSYSKDQVESHEVLGYHHVLGPSGPNGAVGGDIARAED